MAWRMLMTLAAVVACGWLVQACPDHCSCRHEQGLYVANCTSLPSYGGKVEALTLLPSDRPLELVDGQFNSARHLKYLNLRNCSIYFIHKKTFYGAKSVIEVDLSYNQIQEIEPTVFQHLTSLATLILRGNPIQFLSKVPFLISNSLQHLDIGDCKIKHVPRGVFYGLKRLKYLSLDKNLLKSIKYNSLPKGLKYLDISKNLIVNVPTEVLSSLTNLRRLSLGGNPINCSCSLLNLQDWLSGRGVIFEDDVICALPPQYRGVSWSKVNENTLCLAEARREQMYHTIYNPLFKGRLMKDNYFDDGNSYQEENFQSDQPQPYMNLNSDAEVLFQNDETLAMGEMMRDEDSTSGLNKENNDETEVDGSKDKADDKAEQLDLEDKVNEESNGKYDNTLDKNEETNVSQTHNSETENIPNIEEIDVPENLETKSETPPTDIVNLIDNKSVEFKTLSEDDSNTDTDDLKNEGLLHAEANTLIETNSTEEGSTILPELEETTEEEIPSTEETPTFGNTDMEGDVVEELQNVTSSTETYNATMIEFPETPQEIEETVPSPTTVPDLYSENNRNETNITGLVAPRIEPEVTTELSTNDQHEHEISPMTRSKGEEKIKQVAGAEVVMFCVGVLIVCLILYSVYRCRKKKRQTVRIIKEKPSNRDTEMQDMASLLPKPQEEDRKNNSKYPEKPPSSETEKLISNENEKETPTITPMSETNGKIEDKNSINNNTPNDNTKSTSKSPLIQSGKPITINPTAPIQRTKVKVGIIPDSIPRTPIFLQKTYNGTKNV